MIGTLNEALMKGWGGGGLYLSTVFYAMLCSDYTRESEKTAKPIFKKFANINLSMF